MCAGCKAATIRSISPARQRAELQKLASELGVSFDTAPPALAAGGSIKLRTPRIGLADQYGGSMPSGWTRFILEQFEFPFEVVYPKALDAGNLSSRFDVLIFPSGVGPAEGGAGGGRGGSAGGGRGGGGADNIPAEYQPMLGSYTAAETGPQLRKFVEDGGTVLAVGRSAMNLAQIFRLPVSNHLVERSPDGTVRPLSAEKYYVPGSVLRMVVDNTAPIAHGFETHVDVFFDNSPVFSLGPEAQRERRQTRGLVRYRHAVAQWMGLRAGLPERRCRGRPGHYRKGSSGLVCARDHVPGTTAWHVQVPLQRYLPGGKHSGGEYVHERCGKVARLRSAICASFGEAGGCARVCH